MTQQSDISSFQALFPGNGQAAQQRMAVIVETMREMSTHTNPQDMVQAYSRRMSQIFPADRSVSISRRDLNAPRYRITRSSIWKEAVNPWKHKDRLPVHDRGLIGELIYSNEPRLLNDLQLQPDDPAAEHLDGMRSVMALPLFDGGEALNMVLMLRAEANAFSEDIMPELVWMSNLFGRATHSLVLAEQLKDTMRLVDRELEEIASIQRQLLPARLPEIPGLTLATHYQTSRRAGGDYFDFFELQDGRWGILIADVSGHGIPAAVVMAMTRAVAHAYPRELTSPAPMLEFINCHLCGYGLAGTFVTAFFGVYNPAERTMTYSSAGHNPPRVKHCSDGRLSILDNAQALPLGILAGTQYPESTVGLGSADQMIFYTDGITEAAGPCGQQFGVERLDAVLENCSIDVDALIKSVLEAVDNFTAGLPADDDRTLVVAKLT